VMYSSSGNQPSSRVIGASIDVQSVTNHVVRLEWAVAVGGNA
jgi:hypothetical protein